MRLLHCAVENFGSYKHLELDLSNIGLGLIYGRTGSGKSTIPDMACWVLYGQTAKDGAVDEVRSWQSPGEPTSGILTIELPDGKITITRVRGKQPQNDLYWTEESSPDTLQRGKDINDTQRKLNKRLGVDADLYISGSYFHEFSPSGSFFTAKAKERRELFEGIADLSLSARLSESVASNRKSVKSELSELLRTFDQASGRLEALKLELNRSVSSESAWAKKQVSYVQHLKVKAETFEQDKASRIERLSAELKELRGSTPSSTKPFQDKITALKVELKHHSSQKCGECGGPKAGEACEEIRQNISDLERVLYKTKSSLDKIAVLEDKIKDEESSDNLLGQQLDSELSKVNPFTSQIEKVEKEIVSTKDQLKETESQLKDYEHLVTSLDQLQDLAVQLRGELLRKAVKDIQDSTNDILERHFDAELRVNFEMDGDNLNVGIRKSGYDCVYRQLSKGQRQLLKLSFTVSVMRASANRAGIHFQNLWFDEALDGLDADLKVKAFGLFSELETQHESIIVIEHLPDFQNLFTKRFHVVLNGDVSEIALEEP